MSSQTPVPLGAARGLQNQGNTCFANATLQVLLSSLLPKALITNTNKSNNPISPNRTPLKLKSNSKKCKWLQNSLIELYSLYEESTDDKSQKKKRFSSSINPRELTTNVSMISSCMHVGRQEDAHEYLKAVLDTLFLDGHNKRVQQLFDGSLVSCVTCQSCDNKSITREKFLDLSLDISDKQITSLELALEQFTKIELLSTDNKVDCDGCKKRQQVTKGTKISTTPNGILSIHFKRFEYNMCGHIQRINKRITFPPTLDLSQYMQSGKKKSTDNNKYNLFGLVIHKGSTCQSGHYISYVKRNSEWWLCNDSLVSKVSASTVMKQDPYMVFYEQKQHNYPLRSATPMQMQMQMQMAMPMLTPTPKQMPRSMETISTTPNSTHIPKLKSRRVSFSQNLKRMFSCGLRFRTPAQVTPRDDEEYADAHTPRRSNRLSINTNTNTDYMDNVAYSPLCYADFERQQKQLRANSNSPMKRAHSDESIAYTSRHKSKKTKRTSPPAIIMRSESHPATTRYQNKLKKSRAKAKTKQERLQLRYRF